MICNGSQPTLTRAIGISSYSSTKCVVFKPLDNAMLIVALQFDLVDKKELAPLDELNDAILAEDRGR